MAVASVLCSADPEVTTGYGTGINESVRQYKIAIIRRAIATNHPIQLEKIGLAPLLSLGMRLGEGTGAVLATLLVEAGCKILGEMATFEEAGVSEKQ